MTDAPKEMPQTVWLDKFDGCQTWAFSRNYFGEGGGPTDEMEVTKYYRADLSPSVKSLEWQPIETAPKDGTLVDLLCADPACVHNLNVRLTDCAWHVADDLYQHTGWVRVLDDGDWDLVEGEATSPLGLPWWMPTHWMPLPDGPSDQPTPSDKDAEIERLREALTPSGSTKAAYIGEFAFPVRRLDEDGNEYSEMIDVPWTTIKEIMVAIADRAALEERG